MEASSRLHQHPPEEDEGEKEKEDWSHREGWTMVLAHGCWWYFKVMFPPDSGREKTPCGQLEEGNLCGEWDNPEGFRPICRYWPMHPSHVEMFPGCGFKFEKREVT